MASTEIPRLRGAVIGYGFISSRGHVPAYRERARDRGDVEIVAVADLCEGRLARVREALPEARLYGDYQNLLEKEAGRIDFVDISTPPFAHASIAGAALERGLHVLCEKPLTTSLADARGLLERATRARRVLFPCHNYKHAPVVKAIQSIIQSGRIGGIRSLTLSTFRTTHAKGEPEWNTDWRRDARFSGGGIAMDHGSHSFYLTFDWMGSYPTAVTAKMSNLRHEEYDTEDNFSAVLTFPNGLAQAHLSWTAGVRKVIYTLQGEKGAITADDDDLQLALQRRMGQGPVSWEIERSALASHWMDASHVSWFNSLFDQFRTAIRNDDFVGKEAIEAYRCIELITRAYESARQQCRELPLEGPPRQGVR